MRLSATILNIQSINFVVSAFSRAFRVEGPVLEIGSYHPPGWDKLCNRRVFFQGRKFIGCDIRDGNGVDRIEDAHRLSFPDRSFGTVLLLETIEHLPDPEVAITQCHRVLTDDGLLLISTPFDYRLHGFPQDYWRFTASGLREMLSAFPQKMVFAIGPQSKPLTIFAVVRKTKAETFEREQREFRSLLDAASKRLRHRLAFTALQYRARDLAGLMLGRARVGIQYHD